MHLFSPVSRDEAIDLIQTFTPTFDTPGQRQLFAPPSLHRLFDNGQRAPERVWAVDGPSGRGLIAGRLMGEFVLIDMLSLPQDEEASALLVDAATAWARTHAEAEVSFEAAATPDPLVQPDVARVVSTLGRAGWAVHVTRRHYHLAAADAAAASSALPLSADLQQAADGDRDRLIALLTRVLPGSMDIRDQELLARVGLAAAATEHADDLLEADPIDCIRFAVIDGEDAGLVSWLSLADGRAYVLMVGVAVEHRGRGLGGELVAAATRELLAGGTHTLIADTDDANIGMIRGFARAGWQPTQARIDLAPA